MPERRPVGDTMSFSCVIERILGVEMCSEILEGGFAMK